MRGAEQRHAFHRQRVEIQDFRRDGRLTRQLREGANPPLERLDLRHDDLHGLIDEGAILRRLPRGHLFDRQPDRRQRVLQLVRRLARQRLPAGHLRQIHQPLAVSLQLIRHPVERVDGPSHFVITRGTQPPVPLSVGKRGQSAGQLPNGGADPMGDDHNRHQGNQPDQRQQQKQRERESAPQVERISLADNRARPHQLARELTHADTKLTRVHADATVGSPHVLQHDAPPSPASSNPRPRRSPRTPAPYRATPPRPRARMRQPGRHHACASLRRPSRSRW